MQNTIMLVGEAYGENEERERAPFVGAAGWHLTKMLEEAEINRADCYLTNVFNLRPPGNKIEAFCGPKELGIEGYPALIKGKYIGAEYTCELERLGQELDSIRPNIVVALGNTATWALLGKVAISKMRGSTFLSTHLRQGIKVLPTYHPAAILRGSEAWANRPLIVLDLMKAKRESAYPEIRRPERTIYIPETLEDLHELTERYLRRASRLAVDIETSGKQITCIGFAPSSSCGVVIPFTASGGSRRHYWKNGEDEYVAWRIVQDILGDTKIHKTFQNGLYDIAFLLRSYGIVTMGADEDTMLLHHALQPESLKGLGFLGSIYTNEGNWKSMRSKHETIKQDD